jgi:hypothetical protein
MLVFVAVSPAALAASWSLQNLPQPAPDAQLNAVSCSSPGACTAVGMFTRSNEKAQKVLVERWNGTGWQIQGTPNVVGGIGPVLSGVSCSSSTTCIAVGNFRSNAGEEMTLAEGWNGRAWKIEPTPSPVLAGAGPGNTQDYLNGVSCTSANACIAVGYYSYPQADDAEPLAEHWDGTRWAVRQPYRWVSFNYGRELTTVSCGSASACVAVGYGYAAYWDGMSWKAHRTPYIQGANLGAISCSSASACTAVGRVDANAEETTLAERWDGTSWTAQSTPNPTHVITASTARLDGVSCPSMSECIAVGGFDDSPQQGPTLAELWDGTAWTLQSIPSPTGSGSGTTSYLNSISCTTTDACTAIGNYHDLGTGTDHPFAERYS